ncbi:4Fe-4S binding protein [Sporomusa acidovorans]|uniref:Iron-sulfur cluster carrier protein n=1 Tax=Sporomusa acidovorans (strain ATCC 49682 / DSM 3132 / Mol) TaxID=1123286 RepID=A0ABZ3J1A4_SPOA4|nr:ATP-binding protein [Sporomusa acidovorans]OZC14441.1 electron transport complex subunit RsxB [Sporomusa acidovorans DSM 3132]SDF50314.1 MinD superfamily P-loop ATPase, contains an inserted ferredoxin domain [Sporomusa acidovorans]
MLISIASGKGGTGKTTLALLLAAAHSQLTLIDCDVEEPNCHLFLQPQWQGPEQEVTIMVPSIDNDRCNGCGACSAVCLFSAIAVTGKSALLFDELCHSCGGCLLACQQHAISEKQKPIGILMSGTATAYPGIHLLKGTLKVGTPSAVSLIKRMKQESLQLTGDILIDCPPGTSCSMVSAVKGSDFCILVTEPTPFGKHDLELAMNITRLLQIPTGVVINKSDGAAGDESIETFSVSRQIPVLAKIPHSLSFARQYAAGCIPSEFQNIAASIWQRLTTERSARA